MGTPPGLGGAQDEQVSVAMGEFRRPNPRDPQSLTRSGDIGSVAGTANLASCHGHQSEFVENVLGRIQGQGQPSWSPLWGGVGK